MLVNLENKVSQNISIIRFFEILIFFCIPIAFILGSFLVNVVLVLTSIYLFLLSVKKQISFEDREIFIFFTILIFLVINSLLSDVRNYSLYKSISYLRFIFFLLFGVYFLITLELKLKKIFVFMLISVVTFVSFDTFIQFLFKVDLFGNKVDFSHAWGRLSGPFGSEYIIGIYLFCFGFIGLAMLKYVYNVNKITEIIYISILCIIIFLTGERNAALTTLLFLFILFVVNKKIRITLILSTLIVIISCFLILKNSEILTKKYSFSSLPTSLEKNVEKIDIKNTKSIYENIKNQTQIINNSHWFMHYRGGIEIFKNNIFFGSGFKSFRFACNDIQNIKEKKILCSTHPHNMYIEFISDTGALGFLIFLCFTIYMIYYFFKKKLYKNEFDSIIFAIFFSFIFPLKPHGSMFSTNNAFMYWYILTFLIWSFFYKNNSKYSIKR
tara:strand:- start:10146 stop:11465 length:1320 start_codon:yes stop_codon:yes gene_type:complete